MNKYLEKIAVYMPGLYTASRSVPEILRSPELGGLTRPLSVREIVSSPHYRTPTVKSLRDRLGSNSLTYKVKARKDTN